VYFPPEPSSRHRPEHQSLGDIPRSETEDRISGCQDVDDQPTGARWRGSPAPAYLEKFQVLKFPAMVRELCGRIEAGVRDVDGRSLVDVVAGPTGPETGTAARAS
jgi:hypothetical protein